MLAVGFNTYARGPATTTRSSLTKLPDPATVSIGILSILKQVLIKDCKDRSRGYSNGLTGDVSLNEPGVLQEAQQNAPLRPMG